jgi:kumamolisin
LPEPAELLKRSGTPRTHLSHDAFEKLYGADAKHLARIRAFAKAHHLTVVRESAARRSVMLSGTVADFSAAFGVQLKIYEYPGGTYRGRTGHVRIPADLAPLVEGVFGLDNRPVAKPHVRFARQAGAEANGGANPFNPDEVARVYNFPPNTDGSGQCIGIIELGGGYRPQDLQAYFQGLGLAVPTVIPVSVDGAQNVPTTANSDDAEVVLDIEVAGAVAPGAKIVVYFAPNDRTSKGFLDAITKAVHDSENDPSVISISWGGPEQGADDGFQTQFDQVLQAAAMLGITVCVAAGDNGAADVGPLAWDGQAHVDFPASSPFALACGGTRLIAAQKVISSESIWNQHAADTSPSAGPDGSFGSGGGGVSGAFPLPEYQAQANVPLAPSPVGFKGRGVPDITGDGDPDTGYNVLVDGQPSQIGGTSAVAPLWAGLIARINQQLKGRVGFINPQLYALTPSSGGLHDISVGDNRVSFQGSANVGYDAGVGWDACSGLGSPDGTKLSELLTVSTPAPQPQPVTSPRPAARRAARRAATRGSSALSPKSRSRSK